MENYKKFTFYNDCIHFWRGGHMTVECRSIGHKWVWLRYSARKQWRKIPRTKWNQIASSKQFKEVVA